MKRYKLKVGIDCDDVLYSCNQYALNLLNEEKKYSPPLNVDSIRTWGKNSKELDERIKYFKEPEFVASQPTLPGAKEFIKELSKKVEVFIPTAVPPECMSARAIRLVKDFPCVPTQNIILSDRKDVLNLDIVLDDGSHNILKSAATYPVLMRRPWNSDLSGGLSVNSYKDFLHLIDIICDSYSEVPDLSNGGVICLVGPSGSGKTAIMQELIKEDAFIKPMTTTTRKRRDTEDENAYRFISEKQFIEEKNEEKFLETSVYSGCHYGTSKEKIDNIVSKGKFAVMPIDICGAIAIKNTYRSKALTIFIDRQRQDVILEIISRNISNEDKMHRLISLDNEYKNETLCDTTIKNNSSIENATKILKEKIYRRE